MIALATNIYDFTNWLKYGTKTVSKEMLIDLFDTNQKSEILFKKVGLFEDDFEIFFCVLDETIFSQDEVIFSVMIHQITEIKPLSEKVIPILKQKLGDYKISAPIDKSLYDKLQNARLNKLSFDGLNYIKESFLLDELHENVSIFTSLFDSKLRYFLEKLQEKDSWFDFLISYERAKPYPIADIGFLYDVGAIYRERFNITDGDIASRELLKTQDPDKYELISHIVELSKFLQTANQERPFSSFLEFYKNSELLKVFNKELHQKEIPETLNHILLYAFFFKFRKLIRDAHDLTDSKFILQVENYIKNLKDEATISLSMCGLMFGSLKLRELYYASKILPISNEPNSPLEQLPTAVEQNSQKQSKVTIANDLATFDRNTILEINLVIANSHDSIKKKVNKALEMPFYPEKESPIDKKTSFINELNRIVKDGRNQSSKFPLTTEIVERIKAVI